MKKVATADIVNTNVKILSQKLSFKKDFFGDAPAPFIGRYGYPNVNVGVLSAIEAPNVEELDAPRQWSAQNKGMNDIIGIRSSLINSRFQSSIYSKQEKLNLLAQEVGLSAKAAEVEINLKDSPAFKLQTDKYAPPRGPNAELLKAAITSNTSVPTKVEKVHGDTDLKANEALRILYSKGVGENHLSQILSVGAVGIGKNRKLVPTRWSITATDDTVGKQNIGYLKDFRQIDHYQIYFGGYLGNYYLICMLPEVWSYELFEMHTQTPGRYSTDVEMYAGRKDYAETTAGGYYSVRLAITEHMLAMKRQGLAVAFRFITPEYSAPLGVWVTREATRRALQSKPFTCYKREEFVKEANRIIKEHIDFDLDKLMSKSELIKLSKQQTKLFDF